MISKVLSDRLAWTRPSAATIHAVVWLPRVVVTQSSTWLGGAVSGRIDPVRANFATLTNPRRRATRRPSRDLYGVARSATSTRPLSRHTELHAGRPRIGDQEPARLRIYNDQPFAHRWRVGLACRRLWSQSRRAGDRVPCEYPGQAVLNGMRDGPIGFDVPVLAVSGECELGQSGRPNGAIRLARCANAVGRRRVYCGKPAPRLSERDSACRVGSWRDRPLDTRRERLARRGARCHTPCDGDKRSDDEKRRSPHGVAVQART